MKATHPRLVAIVLYATSVCAGADEGRLTVNAVDKASGQPVAARMHLRDARGRPIKPRKVPYWKDHFVFDGTITLDLPLGTYLFEMERGPEYKLIEKGTFTLERNSNDTKTIELTRYVDMAKEGWWSGDLHIHRSPAEIELLMSAEDLHVGPVITWWHNRSKFQDQTTAKAESGKRKAEKDGQASDSQERGSATLFDKNRLYSVLAGEDEREGGALLFFNLTKPLPLAGATLEYPSGVKFLQLARESAGIHVDAEKPFWWDMPVWVAAGKIDSIELANNHEHRDGVLDNEAWGKPRETALYPSPHGNGRWSEHIYYQLLNCGLRIPPSAGSASGVLPNPVGYNRVYVHCGPELTWDSWWQNLRRGRVVVTNGPLLRPRVYGPGADQDGALPGHVFQGDKGQTLELQIALNLATRDPIDYLEVIKDGKKAHEVRLDEWANKKGMLPPLTFDRSGWFLIRAVTNNSKTYRFASTGPYYVEIGYEPRISKRSAQFFVDWVYERARRIKLEDASQKEEVLQYHRVARDFWQKKLEQANAE
jgi:hypothetical protein